MRIAISGMDWGHARSKASVGGVLRAVTSRFASVAFPLLGIDTFEHARRLVERRTGFLRVIAGPDVIGATAADLLVLLAAQYDRDRLAVTLEDARIAVTRTTRTMS